MLEHISFRWDEVITEQTAKEFPSSMQADVIEGIGRTFQQIAGRVPEDSITVIFRESGLGKPLRLNTRSLLYSARQAVFMVRLYKAYTRLMLEHGDDIEVQNALTEELRDIFLTKFNTEPDFELIGHGTAYLTPKLVKKWTDHIFDQLISRA